MKTDEAVDPSKHPEVARIPKATREEALAELSHAWCKAIPTGSVNKHVWIELLNAVLPTLQRMWRDSQPGIVMVTTSTGIRIYRNDLIKDAKGSWFIVTGFAQGHGSEEGKPDSYIVLYETYDHARSDDPEILTEERPQYWIGLEEGFVRPLEAGPAGSRPPLQAMLRAD